MDALSDDDFQSTSGATGDAPQAETGAQMLKCPTCKHKAPSVYYLRKHVEQCHAKAHQCQLCSFTSSLAFLKDHMMAEHQSSVLACDKCPFVAPSGEALRTHRRRKHAEAEDGPRMNVLCAYGRPDDGSEGGCPAQFSGRSDLRKHLAQQHSVASAVGKIEVDFSSEEDLQSWKSEYERRHGVFYTREGAKPGQWVQYQCSRSGVHAPSGSGRRRLKSQGSAKMGFKCTSTLHVRQREGGRLSAVLHTHHHGHGEGTENMPYIRLPRADRSLAKAQLVAGVSAARVMRNLREQGDDGPDGAGSSRAYWVQRKDMHNMCRSLGISPGGESTKHANEITSVRMYAEELRASDQHHLLAFKLPGEEGTSGTESLDSDDFVFAFCTRHQLTKLVQHGNAIVCMDGTHGTSGHDFHLITLLVINEYGAGLPVAWVVSNRENEAAISCLLRGLVKACEDARTHFPMAKYFMSDKAPAYYNACVSSTGQGNTQHLLCAWHVVKAWKAKLPLIRDMVARQEVYDALWGIMHEADEAKAVTAAEALARSLLSHANTRDFGQYFADFWLDCTPKWSLGRRDAAGVSTNMHVEAFHRVLKYHPQYLEGRVNKRVDRCIGTLLNFADDQMQQMARRQLWQAPSKHGEDIARRHATAAELIRANHVTVTPVADSVLPAWEVRSGADEHSSIYQVEQEHRQCPDRSCQQLCRECRACIHHFRCSCPDWTGHKLLCKHVHAVCQLVVGLTSQLSGPARPPPPETTEPGVRDDPAVSGVPESLPRPSRSGGATGKQRLAADLAELAAMSAALPDLDENCLAAAHTKVRELRQFFAILPGASGTTRSQLPSAAVDTQPWNARIQPQPTFQSRRAKRSAASGSGQSRHAKQLRADSVTARELVSGLSHGDVGRERVPQQHVDHRY